MLQYAPEIWGPHYWFVLHTLVRCFPEHPTEVTKRKYYDFIQNLPLFIPHTKIADEFTDFLENFPLQPYLVNRSSFHRWILFLHNRINRKLNQPEFTIQEEERNYTRYYHPPAYIPSQNKEWLINSIFIICLLLLLLFLRP